MAKVVNLVNKVESGGNVDLSGLQTQIDQCNAKIDEQNTTLTQKINTAQSTADSAASTASTAYSTASSAASTASTAYQTANNAATAASSKGNCKLTSFTYTGTGSTTHSISLPNDCYLAVINSLEYGTEFTVILYGLDYWFLQSTSGAGGGTASWSGRTVTITGRGGSTPSTNTARSYRVLCFSM